MTRFSANRQPLPTPFTHLALQPLPAAARSAKPTTVAQRFPIAQAAWRLSSEASQCPAALTSKQTSASASLMYASRAPGHLRLSHQQGAQARRAALAPPSQARLRRLRPEARPITPTLTLRPCHRNPPYSPPDCRPPRPLCLFHLVRIHGP